MPSPSTPPPQAIRSGTQELYLRMGQFGLSFILAWLLMTSTVKISDTLFLMFIFFIVAGLVIFASARRQRNSAYLARLLRKIGMPMIVTLFAMLIVVLMLQIPIESFSDYFVYLPLIYMITLALESLL